MKWLRGRSRVLFIFELLTLLLLATLITSKWLTLRVSLGHARGGIESGRVGVRYSRDYRPDWDFEFGNPHGWPLEWWLECRGVPYISNDWELWVPVWLPMVVVGFIAGSLWKAELRVMARAKRFVLLRKPVCSDCGYDRAGLAADAKCPECGSLPLVPGTARGTGR